MNTSKKIALHAKVEALQAIVILYPFVSWLPLENSLSQVGVILSIWNPAWSQHRPEVMTTVVYVSEEWKLFKNATEVDIWNDCWTQWKWTDSYLEEAGISQQVISWHHTPSMDNSSSQLFSSSLHSSQHMPSSVTVVLEIPLQVGISSYMVSPEKTVSVSSFSCFLIIAFHFANWLLLPLRYKQLLNV